MVSPSSPFGGNIGTKTLVGTPSLILLLINGLCGFSQVYSLSPSLLWTMKKGQPRWFQPRTSAFTIPLFWILLTVIRYYALSALCALFKHAEMKHNTRYTGGSLRIRYCPVEGTMLIDSETIRNLELIGNMNHRKSSHSLYGFVRKRSHFVAHPDIIQCSELYLYIHGSETTQSQYSVSNHGKRFHRSPVECRRRSLQLSVSQTAA